MDRLNALIAYRYFNENYEQLARLHNTGWTVEQIYSIAKQDSGFNDPMRLEKLKQLIIDNFDQVGTIPLF